MQQKKKKANIQLKKERSQIQRTITNNDKKLHQMDKMKIAKNLPRVAKKRQPSSKKQKETRYMKWYL